MRKSVLTMIAAFSALSMQAQRLTISEAQQLAQENYPAVKRYDLIAKTEQLTVANIAKGWLPQIQFDAQATYQSDVVSLPDALTSMMTAAGVNLKGLNKDQYRVGLSVNQQIFDGGQIANNRKVARAQSRVDEARNEVELYALRQRVDELYFALLLTDEQLRLNREKQTLLQANEDRLVAMLNGGTAMKSDVSMIKAERLSAVQQETQLLANRKALLSVLSVFVGKSITEVVRPALPAKSNNTISRPELAMYSKQIEALAAQEKALKSSLLPRLGVFATGYYGNPGYNMYEDMIRNRWTLNGQIGARLTWNFSAFYTNKNDRKKLRTQQEDINVARETFLFNTRMQVQQEDELIGGYKQMLKNDSEIVALRSDVRRAAEAKLANGIVDTSNVVEEITRENEAEINRATHEIEMLQHIYKRANAIGEK